MYVYIYTYLYIYIYISFPVMITLCGRGITIPSHGDISLATQATHLPSGSMDSYPMIKATHGIKWLVF